MIINSAKGAALDQGCLWAGDFYACLITYMINECNGNIGCFNYDEYQMEINHGEAAVTFCLRSVGNCANAAACDFFDYAQSTMVNDAVKYAISYAYDSTHDTGMALAAQRVIEVGVMETLVLNNVCACDWNTQYMYPKQSFGRGLVCATCPDGGYAIYGYAPFPAGIETCHKYGDVPFTDNIGSGYQTGPCPYIPSSSDWSPNDH